MTNAMVLSPARNETSASMIVSASVICPAADRDRNEPKGRMKKWRTHTRGRTSSRNGADAARRELVVSRHTKIVCRSPCRICPGRAAAAWGDSDASVGTHAGDWNEAGRVMRLHGMMKCVPIDKDAVEEP